MPVINVYTKENEKDQIKTARQVVAMCGGREIEEIESRESGISQATVVSAYDITQKDAEKIAEKTINSKNIITTLKIDDQMIGGVIVETKNKRWENSGGGRRRK